MLAKSLQSCLTLCDPMDCSPQAPLSMGFSKQEYRSGLLWYRRSYFQNTIETQIQRTNVWTLGRGGGMNWEIGIDMYMLL